MILRSLDSHLSTNLCFFMLKITQENFWHFDEKISVTDLFLLQSSYMAAQSMAWHAPVWSCNLLRRRIAHFKYKFSKIKKLQTYNHTCTIIFEFENFLCMCLAENLFKNKWNSINSLCFSYIRMPLSFSASVLFLDLV